MEVPPVSSHNGQQKQYQFMTVCGKREGRGMVIDQFHNRQDGSGREQRRILTLVRQITHVLDIPLVIAVIGETRNFLYSAPQLSTRFAERRIPLWEDSVYYRGFLRALEKAFNLKKTKGSVQEIQPTRSLSMAGYFQSGRWQSRRTGAGLPLLDDGAFCHSGGPGSFGAARHRTADHVPKAHYCRPICSNLPARKGPLTQETFFQSIIYA
jgi:hypothetical protein